MSLLPVLLSALLFQPAFDVASVRPSSPNADGATSDLQPGRFRGTNRTVEWMMRIAYGVQAAQISGGPSWLRSDGFDIMAKTEAPEAATTKGMEVQIRPLLRQLLEDRFQLKVHRETRSAPVFSLVPAKNSPNLTPARGGEMSMQNSAAQGKMILEATAVSMKEIAAFLSKQLGRPVTDRTGLPGSFDIRLEWSPDPGPDSTAASIFAALQEQLGLKLETQRGTVEQIVVDSVSRPSEN